MSGVGPRANTLAPLTLSAEVEPAELPAYGPLLLDVLNRDPALSIRGDEAEESWRVVTPVLDGPTIWLRSRSTPPASRDRRTSPRAELGLHRVASRVASPTRTDPYEVFVEAFTPRQDHGPQHSHDQLG